MNEKAKPEQSRAVVYAESVLEAMRKKPGDCRRYDHLVGQIGNNPVVVFEGIGGGSSGLAVDYLQKLTAIHKPHCTLQALHNFTS